ncbi:MAG: hypothetical protein IT336_05770 [Thermomicrobiales bacterium]|nr:hypothetical protein [Thermomicrobiales bacterium]
MPDFPDWMHTDNHQLWLLIAVCVAMIFTIQAVEEAVEGAWPHQRRPTGMAIPERRAHPVWGVVALLILPGAVLAVANLAVIAWQELERTDTLMLGGILLAAGWVIFLLGSMDNLRVRRLVTSAGPSAPLALALILLVADLLLLIAFLDIRPTVEAVRDALPSLT